MTVPSTRLRVLNDAQVRPAGHYVLYWMIAARRPRRNFGLQRAADWAKELGRPLLVLEPLRAGYEWASERLHRFVIEGMAANAAYFSNSCATHYPYIEPKPGAGSGLLEAFAARAAVVVTDDHPGFFIPRMLRAAALRVGVRFEAVDSNGLLPISLAGGRAFTTAYSFRRFVQKEVRQQLAYNPMEEPLLDLKLPRLKALPAALRFQFPAASHPQLCDAPRTIATLPLDRSVKPVELEGGWISGQWQLHSFIERKLGRYAEARNHPDEQATSGLSPFLHFGHIAAHEVLASLARAEGWRDIPDQARSDGTRDGFWGMSPSGDALMEQLVVWRELAFNTAANLPNYDRYDSLPEWARASLEAHASDVRPILYDLPALENADTHDPVWNAAQRELLREGRMHNYLRMLWGKKILEWSESPRIALDHMVHLNNKYALDGRDPNSHAGMMWIFGRYDRPWAPERPIFGMIRYMSSDSARKKLNLDSYLAAFAPTKQLTLRELAP
jgi:deoxyribodipyrimidine photo-lyase